MSNKASGLEIKEIIVKSMQLRGTENYPEIVYQPQGIFKDYNSYLSTHYPNRKDLKITPLELEAYIQSLVNEGTLERLITYKLSKEKI